MREIKGKKKQPTEEELQKLKYEYEKEIKAVIEYGEDVPEEEKEKSFNVHKSVYIMGILLVLITFALIFWMNKEALEPENLSNWLKIQLMGTGVGDGFPVEIKGTNVAEENFFGVDGNVIALSDTAMTCMNSTGKEVFSVRHSFDNPFVKYTGTNYILYNSGGKGYIVHRGKETKINTTADGKISAAAISQSGVYAVGVQGKESASQLDVYDKTGVKKIYTYSFSDTYITAVALSPNGSMGVVCGLSSDKGELVSKVTVIDFKKTEPVKEYKSTGNMIIDVLWGDSGRIYAVGDSSVLVASTDNYDFNEYSYAGKYMTAYTLYKDRAFVSLSSYEYAGACTIMMFSDNAVPTPMETEERTESLAPHGNTLAALSGGEIIFFDSKNGFEKGRTDAGNDVRAVALGTESMAYVLGISEIRTASIN